MGQRFFETAEPDAGGQRRGPQGRSSIAKTESDRAEAQVTDVRVASASTHFYFARFEVGGGHGWAELNPNGQTILVVRPDEQAKLPAAVMGTVSRFFKSDKILDVHSGVMRFFDLEESNGNDDIVMHIRADGVVESVSDYSQQ